MCNVQKVVSFFFFLRPFYHCSLKDAMIPHWLRPWNFPKMSNLLTRPALPPPSLQRLFSSTSLMSQAKNILKPCLWLPAAPLWRSLASRCSPPAGVNRTCADWPIRRSQPAVAQMWILMQTWSVELMHLAAPYFLISLYRESHYVIPTAARWRPLCRCSGWIWTLCFRQKSAVFNPSLCSGERLTWELAARWQLADKCIT